MTGIHDNEDEDDTDASGFADDASLRAKLTEDGFNPNADGMQWAAAKPKVLVAGAFKVIRTAAEKARSVLGKNRG